MNDQEAFSFSKFVDVKEMLFDAAPNNRSDITNNTLNMMLPGLMNVEFAH